MKIKTDNRMLGRWVVVAILLVAAVILAYMFNKSLEKKTYPLLYPDLIEKYAGEYQLDPYLVAAVIHVESRNRSDAVSSKGAVGLMQVKPDTGEWIAEKLKKEFSPDNLTDPETNIEMGCWFLRFLFDRFEVADTAIAAYNAGHGRVNEWLGDEKYSQDGEVLTAIPFKETREYVEKIQRAYEKYREIYPNAFD